MGGDRDGISQGHKVGQPTATSTSSTVLQQHVFSGSLVPPQALSSSYISESSDHPCSSSQALQCALPHTQGEGICAGCCAGAELPRAAGLMLAPLTPGCPTKIAAMERSLLTFFLFLSFFFLFFSSCVQTSPGLLRKPWHIILQMWHKTPGCKIYPSWQLVVLCNLHQLTETTVRSY